MTAFRGPGGDLLSRVLRQSTIGAEAFDGRVRDGIGSYRLAEGHQAGEKQRTDDRGGRIRIHGLYLSVALLKQNWFLVLSGSSDANDRFRIKTFSVLCPLSSVLCFLIPSDNQAERAISTGKLNALPRLHTRPIDVVVFHGPSGRSRFEAGFPLRCLQRLSIPYIATLHRGWRHDRSTRGTFTPVLSY